ncbi:MAG: ATPase [Nocardiaceae bacterium]|nr:ATPase [Nocardiaceae bacterium]
MATVLGLDIGGSKTQAVRSESGTVVAEALSGSANVTSVGTVEAGHQLDAIVARVGNHDIDAVCAGAAGIDTPAGERRLRDLLSSRFPGAKIRIVHDSQLILAAAGLTDGIAVISGTGSVAWGRAGTESARAGGWGYLLGDEGSGYWIGREAVRHTLARIDRNEHPDRLGQEIAADCGLQSTAELLDHFYAQPERRYWAGRARVVFELAKTGDAECLTIIDQAARHLANLAISVGKRLDTAVPVVLAGGLAVHQPALQRGVRRHLAEHRINDVRILTVDPVRGAIEIAQRMLQEQK